MYKDERNNISKVVNKDKKNAKLAKLDYEVLFYDEVKKFKFTKDKFAYRQTSPNKSTIITCRT